jgi:small-conductance mechanosensitive channel
MDGETPVVMGIRGSTLVAAVLTLLLVAFAHFALRWYTRRRCKRKEREQLPTDDEEQRSLRRWITSTALDLVAPVALVLWIHGLHYALSMLLVDIHQPTIARYGMPTLEALRGIATIVALMWLLSRIGRAVERRLVDFARRTHSRSDDFFLPIVGAAIRLLLPLLAIILGSSSLDVPDRLQTLFRNGVSMVLVGSIGYVLYRVVGAACDLILERYRIDVPDNRQARAVRTQVTVLRKVAVATIVLFSFAAMLMVFDQVRQIGTTMLASAGLAGVVLGFAAQRSLGMLLAGFQIALTQPIRIDDSVIVEGEFGNIEEITLTYVVVKLWDERRLIVPITYFLDKPFQNWTRTSVQLLATVELWVDYNFPIDALREKLTSILDKSKLWDKRLGVMQVTDVREHTVQVRALLSAADAGKAFDLRCEVREELLKFLQQEHAESLPRLRLVRGEPPSAAPAG